MHSFFWLAFAKSFKDRNRTGRIPFNPVKWRDNINSGQTTMLVIGDPMDWADKLFSTLGSLFDDVQLQRLAVGTPCRGDYKKQEDEIVTHLGSWLETRNMTSSLYPPVSRRLSSCWDPLTGGGQKCQTPLGASLAK